MEQHSYLRVKSPNVEEDCSSLKGHGLLGARHSCQRVIPEREREIKLLKTLDSPLKVETTAPVRWEEPPLNEVKLVVVLE